jgi:hypothetical protein
MEGTGTKVNDQMKGSQKVAGFDYSDFESSMTNFDSSFQVCPLSCRSPCLCVGPVLDAKKGATHRSAAGDRGSRRDDRTEQGNNTGVGLL